MSAAQTEGIECPEETPICHRVTDTFNQPLLFQDLDENGNITGLTDLSGVSEATWNIYDSDGVVLVTVDTSTGITIDVPTAVVTVVITPALLAPLKEGCFWWDLIFDSGGVISTEMNGKWTSYIIFPPE